MEDRTTIDRRQFLRSGGGALAGLVVAFHLPEIAKAGVKLAVQDKGGFSPNAFLSIQPDNKITVWVTRSEMGQGVRTALPMMLADELEADWSTIELKQASPGAAFKGIRLRTSGSGSVYGTWFPLRNTGAAAREMLISAAAARWNVEPTSCRAEKGTVIHVPTGRRSTFGDLCLDAAKLAPPEKPVLKDPKDFRFIGKPMKRVDGPAIVSGKAVYGIDVKVPGMRYAVIERSPVLGGKALSWDDADARKVPGVIAVVPVTSGMTGGVAVVAENTWSAMKGRDALRVTWDDGKHAKFSSGIYDLQLAKALDGSAFSTRNESNAATAFDKAATKLEAVYEYPHQAHAPLETMNCIAHVSGAQCEIWSSTQAPERAQEEAAKLLGIPPGSVTVNVTLLGGGFGRRLFVDYVTEAVEVSRAISAPVKVLWTREDDMRHGYFHSSTMCRMRAGFDANKKLTSVIHRTASSDLSILGPPTLDATKYSESWVPWGAYDDPYAFPAYQAEYTHVDSPVPTGPWRAVGYPQNVFARECFVDEIAVAMGKDPLAFRIELLSAPAIDLHQMTLDRPALRKVLEIAAERSGWGKPLVNKDGRRWGRGVACNIYHGESLTAQVAEVSVGSDGKVKVERIVCVIDCGQVINPLGFKGQMESGIVWGLSAALHGKVTFRNGRAEQSSFRDFRVLRINEMPSVEVYAVPSTARPVGVGEPSVPPTAPAVANALFAATGRRVRRLPLIPNAND